MSKTKAKPKHAETGDFTDALRAGDAFTETRVELRPGERRTASTTRRRSSHVVRWHRDGWIDTNEAASLLRFELLQDACGYGSVRSCCDNTVSSGGGGMPPAVARARIDRARAANAVADQVALMAVVEMLADESAPEALRARLFGCVGVGATEAAKRAVRAVGRDLAGYFGA